MATMILITPNEGTRLIDTIDVRISVRTSDGVEHHIEPHTICKLSQNLCECCGMDGTEHEADDYYIVGDVEQTSAFLGLRRFS